MALQMFLADHPELREVVQFNQYGTCDHLSRTLLENFPYPGVVCDRGRVSRQDALAGMAETDVLVLVQNTERVSEETIPSKTYEYLQAERPILGLVQGNMELERILLAGGHEAVPASNPAAVKDAISRQVAQWRSGGFTVRRSPYTAEAAVGELVECARQVLQKQGEGEVNAG